MYVKLPCMCCKFFGKCQIKQLTTWAGMNLYRLLRKSFMPSCTLHVTGLFAYHLVLNICFTELERVIRSKDQRNAPYSINEICKLFFRLGTLLSKSSLLDVQNKVAWGGGKLISSWNRKNLLKSTELAKFGLFRTAQIKT